ncbi:MAG: CoA transferase [Gammaproteobacteria bacterium]|nr:CoA transferase [Gammaproteobacteria bacterium]
MKPLAGLRVIDIATYIAAPYCATLLAEFGAEVIKVEMPGGEPMRNFGSRTDCGETLVWLSEARNKKCITLNLKTADGQALLKRLVGEADVLCENFQTGTLEGWNLGWDTLREINERLVMLRITGYGQTGPYADRPGFGRIANAFGGISFLAGEPDGPPVTPGSATLADYMAGLYGALGVMMALRARDETGRGQVVDLGLYETIFRILDELAPAYQQFGFVRQRMGAATVNVVPHSHYPTSDQRWVAIACTNDKIFARLAGAMGCPEVAGGGVFGTITQREAHRATVDQLVTDWTLSLTQQQVIDQCGAAQVPCGPVASIDEIFENPQYAARENIAYVDDPRIGTLAVPNVVPRLTETPGGIDWLGQPVGSANEEIYGGLLGLSSEEIAKLAGNGVI